ncbi:MAG: 1,4-alpha-glucan branching protein GlgB [Acidimicrobiales bacterium]
MPETTADPAELSALLAGLHDQPQRVLGPHGEGSRWVVRARHPHAVAAAVLLGEHPHPMTALGDGLFEARLPPTVVGLSGGDHCIEWRFANGDRQVVGDPYAFDPVLGDVDLHLIGEGNHQRLWEVLGANVRTQEGVAGVHFAVWAPNAASVRVVGDWNGWDGRVHPMCRRSEVWELFIPLVGPGARYKFEVLGADGRLVLKADPLARQAELAPATASVVADPAPFAWGDAAWLARRATRPFEDRLSVYEVHLGSWRRNPLEANRSLTYRELAVELVDYVTELGFTHVELLPVAEHPFGGSWGYQVSGYYAPTIRYGTPDDFRFLINSLHAANIGVIVDWVPAHFPRDEFALARFDGTALYEHDDPRQGAHPDWGTLVFNFGRNQVRNFLLANALYWIEEFHIDGLRVDAVASMLYLDYSREPGEWIPNRLGGRENLEAIDFLRQFNQLVLTTHPGVLTIAEESTAWAGVSRPPELGGLGFTQKWNMGWMHDTLEYFSKDPLYRSYEHDKLTFGFIYVWHENFVLPLSHDEVVHGKGSLINKMPGDDWQRFANLRALYGWMWAHPGKKLLFMGCELAQLQEWSEERSLDWHLLESDRHAGIQRLVAALNHLQVDHPALWQRDYQPEGFAWLDASDRASSVLAFCRVGGEGDAADADAGGEVVVCAANFTPVPRPGYRIGLPGPGQWRELLNTDDTRFGGSGMVNPFIGAEAVPWHDRDWSAVIDLPPLGVVFLGPTEP